MYVFLLWEVKRNKYLKNQSMWWTTTQIVYLKVLFITLPVISTVRGLFKYHLSLSSKDQCVINKQRVCHSSVISPKDYSIRWKITRWYLDNTLKKKLNQYFNIKKYQLNVKNAMMNPIYSIHHADIHSYKIAPTSIGPKTLNLVNYQIKGLW